MKNVLLHTPEGVRDIYNKECERKLYLQQKIHEVLKQYGYEDIQTPSFEFFDIFSKEKGTVPSREMYKFFDREGNTLVLRPDMTPPIARCISKYYMDEEMPIRLCYCGQAFINSAEHQGKLKEMTHIGAELAADSNADSDAEVIAMVIQSLLECGLSDFQIEVGHAGFFRGLLAAADLNSEQAEELTTLVENKNFFGMEEYISELNIPDCLKKLFVHLPELNGSGEIITAAKEMISSELINIAFKRHKLWILTALKRLEKLYTLLTYYGYEKYVSFDLSAVAAKDYYTGVIFTAYTYGTGDAIATGGRYDNLLSQFGKEMASIGFAINLDRLLTAMLRQKISHPVQQTNILILYENNWQKKAISMAVQYRKDGKHTILVRKNPNFSLEDYKEYAKRNEFEKIYDISDDGILTEI